MAVRTKIVCTIGPSVASYEKITALLQAGMNVARINSSHGSHEEHRAVIEHLKRARKALKAPLAILLDLKGPKIRVGTFAQGAMQLKQGQKVYLGREIPFHPAVALAALQPGLTVLFDDGYIVGKILSLDKEGALLEIQNDGILKSGKGINLPGALIPLPAMSDEDFADLRFGCEQGVDCIAASFIRSAEHVRFIKHELAKLGHPHMPLIAKIESTEGVQNFDAILDAADGIMVARGDLGVEVDLALVPPLQKRMIRKCYEKGKDVITATQMLESMIVHPRPTRAEVSDVANAIYDGSSATMLSAETAVGAYPIETVLCMQRIAKAAEADIDYRRFSESSRVDPSDIAASIALAAIRTAYGVHAKAILVLGGDPKAICSFSSLRPAMPVLAVVDSENHYHQLASVWGVIPILCPHCHDIHEAKKAAMQFALASHILRQGDVVVMAFGEQGLMNAMVVIR